MCLSGDYRVTWDPRINTRMDKQGEVCKGEAVPGPSLGTCSLSHQNPPCGPPSIPFYRVTTLHPLPPARSPSPDPFPYPPMEERVSHFWSPVLCFLLTLTEHLL